jgi:hypothetical protein
VNVPEARWIRAFTPSLNDAAFRVWLAVDETAEGEGMGECNSQLEGDWRLIFAAGTGTGGLTLPTGIGFALAPGEQLVMLVHYVNTTAGTASGNAAIEMLIAGSVTGLEEAEGFLAGTQTFFLPDGQATVVSGGCTLTASTSIFAVMPYMNALGTHARVWTDTPVHTIIDQPYSRLMQGITSIAPYAMDPGDRVRTEFTYANATGQVVTYGDAPEDEVSFVMTYVTPPIGMGPTCTS